ncbi:hypothetical protein QUF90_20400 [Desulfococcaceae bacterium HSG9]|nr:hypothetical protein [Desulfococcaceae bacterium HSG9]
MPDILLIQPPIQDFLVPTLCVGTRSPKTFSIYWVWLETKFGIDYQAEFGKNCGLQM